MSESEEGRVMPRRYPQGAKTLKVRRGDATPSGDTNLHIQMPMTLFNQIAAMAHAEERSLSHMARILIIRAIAAAQVP